MKKETKTNSIGFFGLLQIAFIVLKLCHVIEWSWVWVLAPIWIWVALVLVLFLVIAIYKLVIEPHMKS